MPPLSSPGGAVALLALAFRAPLPVLAARVAGLSDDSEVAAEGSAAFGGDAERPQCLPKTCGAKSWANYQIGVGDKIDYEVNDAECLANCEVKMTRTSCGMGKKKVAREKETKLCCSVQLCTYVPLRDTWRPKGKDEFQRKTLQDLTFAYKVSADSCLCCAEEVEGWDMRVSHLCKLAYSIDYPVAMLGSRHTKAFKSKCHEYCSEFPGYQKAKKALKHHAWEKRPPSASEVVGRWRTYDSDGTANETWVVEERSTGSYKITVTEPSGEVLKGILGPYGEFLVADLKIPPGQPGSGSLARSLTLRAPLDKPDHLFWATSPHGSGEHDPFAVAFRELPLCTRQHIDAEPNECYDDEVRCTDPRSPARTECPFKCGRCLVKCAKHQQERHFTGLEIQGKPASCAALRANARCADYKVRDVCPETCDVCSTSPHAITVWN